MTSVPLYVYLLVMAGTTYLIRMIPFTVFRRKIKSRFLRSLFYYLPYTVLSAMTFPFIFYSTGSFITALCGTIAALTVSYFRNSLIIVSLAACAGALISSFAVTLF